jgi:hypothetical protein
MKFPVFPNLANVMMLAAALLATAGCGLFAKREPTRLGSMPPVATPVPGATPPPLGASEKGFFNTAFRIIAYERKLGSLARQYGNSDDARNLGGLMETEMALAAENLKALAASKKLPQIDSGAGWGHGGSERLASQRGGEFDRKFYEEVKLSGKEAYGEFDQAFQAMVDIEVREFAKNW